MKVATCGHNACLDPNCTCVSAGALHCCDCCEKHKGPCTEMEEASLKLGDKGSSKSRPKRDWAGLLLI